MVSLINKIKTSIFYNEDDIHVKINVWRLLFHLNLIVYGFYGALVSSDKYVFLMMTLFVVIIQISFSLIEKRKLSGSFIQISINSRIIVLFLLVLLLISNKIINNSLIGDELSYTQSALKHSFLIGTMVIKKYSHFDTIQFKYIALVINIIITIFLIITICFLNSVTAFKRIVISVILMLIFRGIIFKLGGNASPHPPLNHIFTLIVSSVFPLSNFSIRFSYLVIFTMFAVSIYYLIRVRFSSIYSFLITCIIISIPPLLHLGISIEPSLLTTCLFSYILTYFVIKDNVDYGLLILLASVFTTARISSVIILLPIFLFYIKTVKLKNRQTTIFFINQWTPILLFLPFLIFSVIKGTPATEYSGSDVHLIKKYIFAFESNIIWHSLFAVIPLFWIMFLPFSFFKKNKNYLHSAIYLFTFFILVAVFYSLKSHLWGNEKYQDEMFMPFIIVGFIQILIIFDIIKLNQLIKKILLFSVLLLNLFYFGSNRNIIENSNINKDYPYKLAYDYIDGINGRDSTLSVGLTYGVLPEIISGYSSFNYKRALEIFKDSEQDLFSTNSADLYKGFATRINENKNIRYIILGLTSDKKLFLNIMLNNNWVLEKKFKGKNSAFTVEILKKNY